MQHLSPYASTLHFTANVQPRIELPQRDNVANAALHRIQSE